MERGLDKLTVAPLFIALALLFLGACSSSPPAYPGVSRAELNEVIQAHRGEVLECYNAALKREPGLRGKLVTAFTILPAGDISNLRIARATTVLDLGLQQCVLKKMSAWRFPSKEPFPTDVAAYPFYLQPAG